jgi:glycosyltransferase involved in cell wall biosynthesis
VRIYFLIGTLKIGGTETSIVELVNYLSRQKSIEVVPVLYGRGRELEKHLTVPLKVIPYFRFVPQKHGIQHIIRLLYLRLWIAKKPPDYVLSFGEVWNNYALLLSVGFNLPKIIADRGDYFYPWPVFHLYFRSIFYSIAEHIVLQRDDQLAQYQKFLCSHQIQVIKNHFPSKKKDHIKAEIVKKPKSKMILTVGRFIPSKRIEDVIQVFYESKLYLEGYHLFIVGDDDLGNQLKSDFMKKVEHLNISPFVFFLGFRTDVLELMCEAQAFVFTSVSEGMPNVLIEALFAHCQVFTLHDYLKIEPLNVSTYHVCTNVPDMAQKMKQQLSSPVTVHFEDMAVLENEFSTHGLYSDLVMI